VTFFPSTLEDTLSIEATPAFDPALTFLLENDQGEAMAYGRNTLRGEVRDGWIDVLGVLPEYQGRGLGRFILLHCMYVLAQARPKTIRLSVEATNDKARALYDSEGFMEVRTRLRYRKPL
jgi:ribosomal protein S18 acetylase RimI-like enzyme